MATDVDGFKVRFAERNHQPSSIPTKSLLHGATISDWVHPDTSIVLGERGKKTFEPRYGAEEKPFVRKILPRQESGAEEARRGKRCVGAPVVSQLELSHNQRVHYPEFRSETGNALNFARKKSVLQAAEPKYYDIEKTMNRKQRLPDIEHRRNGIDVATPGDKPFKQADREPGFYAKGGIIPGSTMTLRKSAKPELRKRDDVTKGPTKKLEATYGKLIERRERQYDVNQVRTLTKPSKTHQGEEVPSWEARTGNHLVDPDDESVY